ncbi:hypothetical protein EKO27_g5918 [Xylaria grammica]|uniref:Methyltransferase domain-containing protein n=1 Tax=Xylaria grammica TaxID=363999 RepID=A0A439D466_9PEZI|nr:hypothetical protein EKO27_g5918 [Xylaria grammica]
MATTSGQSPAKSPASSPRQTTPAPAVEATTSTTTTSDGPQAGTTTTTAAATTAQPTTSGATTISITSTPALVSAETAATSATTSTTPAIQGTAQTDVLPASHWAQVPQAQQEDDFDDDVDSAYGDDNASSTASLSASILEYRTVHGRTYHSERGNAQSWNPNDAQHDESMDILHHVSTLMQDGKITMAHIDDSVQKVLDVACGTGIWAIDFADQYPHAEVIGVDISPSQPQWIPPNLKFEIDDITLPWTYEPNSFDYIHARWLIGAIPSWYTLFSEVFRALKPGGIFESKESSAIIQSDDGTVPRLLDPGRQIPNTEKLVNTTRLALEQDVEGTSNRE